MNAEHTFDCGCSVRVDVHQKGIHKFMWELRLYHCPLHGAADQLLSHAQNFVAMADQYWRIQYHRPWVQEIYRQAQAAIAAAEGEGE